MLNVRCSARVKKRSTLNVERSIFNFQQCLGGLARGGRAQTGRENANQFLCFFHQWFYQRGFQQRNPLNQSQPAAGFPQLLVPRVKNRVALGALRGSRGYAQWMLRQMMMQLILQESSSAAAL
jgi:hypothetical protein